VNADLTALAAWLDTQLDDEHADRQTICEDVSARLLQLAAGPQQDHGLLQLTAEQRDVLGQVLADAVTYRDPSGACTGCDASPAGLCADHAEDLDKTDLYLALARHLAIEVDR
jgi:hypothetical protein